MNNTDKFHAFREKYPLFVYENFKYSIEENGLKIELNNNNNRC